MIVVWIIYKKSPLLGMASRKMTTFRVFIAIGDIFYSKHRLLLRPAQLESSGMFGQMVRQKNKHFGVQSINLGCANMVKTHCRIYTLYKMCHKHIFYIATFPHLSRSFRRFRHTQTSIYFAIFIHFSAQYFFSPV